MGLLFRAEITHWMVWITDAFNCQALRGLRYRQHFKGLASSTLFHLCQQHTTHPCTHTDADPVPKHDWLKCFLHEKLGLWQDSQADTPKAVPCLAAAFPATWLQALWGARPWGADKADSNRRLSQYCARSSAYWSLLPKVNWNLGLNWFCYRWSCPGGPAGACGSSAPPHQAPFRLPATGLGFNLSAWISAERIPQN